MTDPESLRRPKWPDRRFHFVHPLWMLPDFAERLSGTPARLEEVVGGLPPSVLLARLDGTWSIQQNAGHLADVEELWHRRFAELVAGAPTYSPADPAHFAARAERHETRSMREVLQEFRTVRAAYMARLVAAPPELQRASAYHERLGCRMRLIDMAQFAAEHDDHHLLRIRFLARHFSTRPPETSHDLHG